ncbi:MAG: HAMP domain-containing sensor histidine kinase, partial [bacterium]
HELEVHQIELELQNQELQTTKASVQRIARNYLELFDFAPVGYMTLSELGKIHEVNLFVAKMLGKERYFLQGSQFGFFVSEDSKPLYNSFLEKVFKFKTLESCELTLKGVANMSLLTHLSGIVSEDESHCKVILVDLSEIEKKEKALRESEEKLLLLMAEKDKFFSVIAHDLRNPFNSFLGLTRIMAEELPSLPLDQAQKIAVNMRNSATNLFNLLENLLDWSRMQRGVTPFEPESSLLVPYIEECIQMGKELSEKKGIQVGSEIPEGCRVFADKFMIRSILRNLVVNAIKFTGKGGQVVLSAKQVTGNSVEMAIKDSGIGMNMQMMKDIFRLDIPTERKGTDGEPSTGLGLIICKDFIEKHGGELRVESEEGGGSTFYFTLPEKKN